jgi:hypothetical protein
MTEFLERKEPLILDFGDGVTGTHTSRINKDLYDVFRMRPFAESLPISTVPLENFERIFREGNNFWTDNEGNPINISEIVNDWESAKNNPLWKEHIAKIENADHSYPIWVYGTGDHVIDGMHRLVNEIINQLPSIQVKYWTELPEEAKLESNS